ncbi:MAG: hypothetical protein A3F84_29190 [Candidatus Handelsmanbacteria bacterium RIFCSPLOWO2_12_FULL_64_10]|uniref:Enoyl reductase (ER) domain-containing protein n=1 Tax=Handelsmanbacteria sp. (strain RIFCSPLOWO2_12_FULL_64_10) TaxID=1817868 RepID=A0A1F6D2G9_HANXR|nr:MAG: hypothetical protein A3F84_29190 [Candidatus Handelsmanbacteria bacterium RIFCSPLOWO2_12_FULL_64_10]
MKAVRKLAQGTGHVALCDVPEPDPRPGHAKIAVRAAGICGTDIHILHGGYAFNPPVTLGHEFAGEVVEVGKGVDRVRAGDRVTVLPSAMGRCGVCRFCRSGYYFYCVNRSSIGSKTDGGFADYCVAPEDLLYVLPEGVDYRAGSLTEPLACCVQAVCELTDIAPSDVVLISGPGPIGMICAALAKLRGATVILCGTAQDRERLGMARSFGVDRTVDVTAEDAAQVARDMTDGYGADVVLECVGVGASVNQCLDAAARLGRYTQVGLLDHPAQVDFGKVVYKQLRVQGALGQTWSTWEKTLRLLRRGAIDMNRFITHEVPLDRWQEAFDNTEQKRGLKNVLCP